jgi:SAM-dependent methyltransferase
VTLKHRIAVLLARYPGVRMRRAVALGRAWWLPVVPRRVRGPLHLDSGRVDGIRVELGSGPNPVPGYLHIDLDRSSPDLHYVAPVWKLPFRDGEVDEILAIHVLEHVHPVQVMITLAEWRRVLKPGGVLEVRVPDGPAIAATFARAPIAQKWALSAAIYGMDIGPEATGPHAFDLLENVADHKILFDREFLSTLLADAGFRDIEDLTGRVSDRITDAWAHVMPELSLILRAAA